MVITANAFFLPGKLCLVKAFLKEADSGCKRTVHSSYAKTKPDSMRLFILLLLLPASIMLSAQTDSLLSGTVWRETTAGERQDYVLQLNPYGSFEEDAGEAYQRSARYLMGRWTLDTTARTITFAVDYFLGKSMVSSRYRKGQDFYLPYHIEAYTPDSLELKDQLTGATRTFSRTELAEDYEDASKRRLPKPDFGKLKLPKGW